VSRYVTAVQAVLAKLLLLLSVLLMPLGMATTAASAVGADHHTMIAGKPMEHCPDQPGKQQHHDGLMTCSMACSSALPAHQLAQDEAVLPHHELVTPFASRKLRGILPEIATPPPKVA